MAKGKRNPASFAGIQTTMQLAAARRASGSKCPFNLGAIVDVKFTDSDSRKISARGYCFSVGSGRIRLAGYCGEGNVWQFHGPVDEISCKGNGFDLANNVSVYSSHEGPYIAIFRELKSTPIGRNR